MSSVGTLWSAVATVRSGRRTARPASRSPSKACGLVTSWTRWRSMYSRSVPSSPRGDEVAVPHLLAQASRARSGSSHRVSHSETRVSTCGTDGKRRRRARQVHGGPRRGRERRAVRRWPSWSAPPGSPGPPSTGWPSRSRPTACCAATRPGGSRSACAWSASAAMAAEAWPLRERAAPVLAGLRDDTGESVQLYVRDGDARLCVASLESPHELRTMVALGARLPLDRGLGGHGPAGRRCRPASSGSRASRSGRPASPR